MIEKSLSQNVRGRVTTSSEKAKPEPKKMLQYINSMFNYTVMSCLNHQFWQEPWLLSIFLGPRSCAARGHTLK
jgi:hypothetical protein